MSNMEKDERQTEGFANPFLKEGGEEIFHQRRVGRKTEAIL